MGQEHVVQALSNALTQAGHHAYFSRAACRASRILAKSLNCRGGWPRWRDERALRRLPGLPRHRWPALSITWSWTPRPTGGVEEISQLLDQAVYKPVVGRFKVYMIDEVHALDDGLQRHAQDAGGAARLSEVRARHDRPAEGAGHRAVALPAVQPEADVGARGAEPSCQRAAGRGRGV